MSDPIEWVHRLFWSKNKSYKATFTVHPNDDFIDIGPGDLDCFLYLKFTLNREYLSFNPSGYEKSYFCFHKHHKMESPIPADFSLVNPRWAIIQMLEDAVDTLQSDKNLPMIENQKREMRKAKKLLKLPEELVKISAKPQIDISQPMDEIEKELRMFKKTKEWTDEDGLIRYTTLPIITKKKIIDMMQSF